MRVLAAPPPYQYPVCSVFWILTFLIGVLDGITDSMNMNLSELQELVMDRAGLNFTSELGPPTASELIE